MTPLERDGGPIAVRGLTKRFGRLEVLRGVDLDLPEGSVCGLLGLNGSGKTTTLRCSLGLLLPDAGRVSILGLPPQALHRSGGRLGVVLDSPCLHRNLTVRQALEHGRRLCGARSRTAGEVEEMLGLEPYRRVRIRKLSLGNVRRTSIAQALIGRPSLVILDEPFSGLDAGGVDDVVGLIRRLHREEGTTFLLASHQLPYLETICTHVAILHGGRIALGGTIGEVLGGRRSRLRIHTTEPERALDIVRSRDGVRSAEVDGDGRIQIDWDGADPASLNRDLVVAGLSVSELSSSPPSLDTVFREIVGGTR